MFNLRHILFLTAGLLCNGSLSVLAQQPISALKEIRSMPVEEADWALPVLVEAQVVWINPLQGNLFLFDGEVGLFLRGGTEKSVVRSLKAGDLVRVKGETRKGGFVPDIEAFRITVLGHKPRPKGMGLTEALRASPKMDGTWIQSKGRIISKTVSRKKTWISLVISRNDVLQRVQIPYSEKDDEKLSGLLFESVEFYAVCGSIYNKYRQFVSRIYLVNSADDLVVLKARPTGPETELKIHELFRYGLGPNRVIKTQGVVTHFSDREMYLRGEEASLKVVYASPQAAEIGDEVIVSGEVWPQSISPAFRAKSVEVIGRKEQPLPVRVERDREVKINANYDLIEIDAELVEIGKNFLGADRGSQQTLLCRSSDQLFEARMPAGGMLAHEVKPGATLRLTGICHVIRDARVSWSLRVDGFSLELRSLDDVVVLEGPAWWSAERLIGLLGIVVAAMMLFIVWVWLLRRTVGKQTGIIRRTVERESVMSERQRIARELHDNLIQGLVVMEVRLNGCLRRMELNREKIFDLLKNSGGTDEILNPVIEELERGAAEERKSLNDLEVVMDRCSEESRSSILYLRSGMAGRMGLFAALQEVLEPLADETGIKLRVQMVGTARALKQEVERNLMLTTKEAVTNGVRHSGTDRMEVSLSYTDDGLNILVRDHGCGFDPERMNKKGHYGLVSMKERMKQLGGVLQISSVKDDGTEILISLNSTAAWEV